MIDMLTLAADAAAATGASEYTAFFSLAGLAALLSLTILEIVLGIDNVVFIAILAGRLPEDQQARARTVGLLLAMVMRLGLLGLAFLIVRLETPFMTVLGWDVTGKGLLLLAGGLFLIAKATKEIHHLVEGGPDAHKNSKAATFAGVIAQILLLDLVFSIDSVITAVGMTSNYAIMATAVVISIAVMLAFANVISGFVGRHPSVKTLALAFLVLIGVLLVAEALNQHLDRGYVYFAMGFAIVVEMINLKAGANRSKKMPGAGPEPKSDPEPA